MSVIWRLISLGAAISFGIDIFAYPAAEGTHAAGQFHWVIVHVAAVVMSLGGVLRDENGRRP